MLLLLLFYAVAVSAQANTTCTQIEPTDSKCGFLSPVSSLFYKGQAQELSTSYGNQLAIICSDIKTDPQIGVMLPFIFCLGSMGPCNNASFKLPEVDAKGVPKDIKEVATFYNTAKFKDLLPSIEKAGVQPPCYESCRRAVGAITNCGAFGALFDKNADICQGLPLQSGGKCVNTPGPKGKTGTDPIDPAPEPPSQNEKSSAAYFFNPLILFLVINLF